MDTVAGRISFVKNATLTNTLVILCSKEMFIWSLFENNVCKWLADSQICLVSYFRCFVSDDVVRLGITKTLASNLCRLVGKSVSTGHDKSYTIYGKDMLVPVALDDTAVVCPHNDNYPLPSTNVFRMVPVHASCLVGLGSSGSTDLCVNKTNDGTNVCNNIPVVGILYGNASIEQNTAAATSAIPSASASAIASTSAISSASAVAAASVVVAASAATAASAASAAVSASATACASASSAYASGAAAAAAAAASASASAAATATASGTASVASSVSSAADDATTVAVSASAVASHVAAVEFKKREKLNQMACKLHNRSKRTQDWKHKQQEKIKSILSKVNAYLPEAMQRDLFQKRQ